MRLQLIGDAELHIGQIEIQGSMEELLAWRIAGISDASWHHIMAWCDEHQTVRLYFDGVLTMEETT